MKAKCGRPRKLAASGPGGGFDGVLTDLHARRDRLAEEIAGIDRAITALEEIG